MPSSQQDSLDHSICPLPPYRSWLTPAQRTALASHPRSGSTWSRFLLERAAGAACGFEDPGWANVLPHVGGVEGKPDDINQDGLIVKTHSICFGCWSDAPPWKRLRVRNTSLPKALADRLLGPNVAERLEKVGNCLIFPPGTLETAIKVRKSFSAEKKQAVGLHCARTYDRAVVLIRDPLDVFRSNYHYRTKVLHLQHARSWSNQNHYFARERAEAYMNFYGSWRDFAYVRPAMLVYYELLKLHPAHEVQRILQFLQVDVSEAKLRCAVEQSSMGKLKEDKSSTNGRVDARKFFGSRKDTETRENLTYPPAVMSNFESMGLFRFASSMGYITYRGGMKAAHLVATSQVSSRIEVVTFPWQVSEPLQMQTTSTTSQTSQTTSSVVRLYSAPVLQMPMEVSPVQSALGGLVIGLLCGMYLCRFWQSHATKQVRSS